MPSSTGPVDFSGLPSAATPALRQRPRRRPGLARAGRLLRAAGAALITLAVLLAGGGYLVSASGFGAEQMRATAERAAEAFMGADVAASLGPARLSVDGSRLLALQVADVELKSAAGAALAEAGTLSLGFRFKPLLAGRLRLGSARLADARIDLAALPQRSSGDWLAALSNEDGLIDPDLALAAVFAATDRMFAAVRSGSTGQLELENVELAMPPGAPVRRLRIAQAVLSEDGPDALRLEASLDADGRTVLVSGVAEQEPATGVVGRLELEAQAGAGPTAAGGGPGLGSFRLSISGSEKPGGGEASLRAVLSIDGTTIDLGQRLGSLTGTAEAVAVLAGGSGKLEVERLRLVSGRTVLALDGAVGPVPRAQNTGPASTDPAYRFEFVGSESVLAPADSPEAPLRAGTKVSGTYTPAARHLELAEIGVRTAGGELAGSGSLSLAPGKSPGVRIALDVRGLPVADAKQLWPWFVARGARAWVLANLLGGTIDAATLRYQVPPGRIGSGPPLTEDELQGTFRVSQARFTTAGELPPVESPEGTVALRGALSEIEVPVATALLPGERGVAITNARLSIRNVPNQPLVGLLELDVAGDASAIAEVANRKPIDALRRLELAPGDLSGTAKGHVAADIPLQKGADSAGLDRKVELAFRDLAIARPLQGQQVSKAEGTLVVERDRAVVEAEARLNGAPAEISLVEPLTEAGPERQRNVELTLDDKARNALAPGLATMIAGPMRVSLKSGPDGSQLFQADLTKAKLSVPWVGWNKGAGIAAKARFTLDRDGATTRLSDLEISGKSFSAAGEVTLQGGALSSAVFRSVKLNRGDDIAVTVKRSGKGYQVAVEGDAYDARALIKQLTSDAAAKKGGDATPVRVKANVAKLTGFNGAALTGLELEYSGSGARLGSLVATASASAGGKISIRNTVEDGTRVLEVDSANAGALLRFLDVYGHMEGGSIRLALAGAGEGPMQGRVDARDFWVVDEPRLGSLVSSPPPGDNRSLSQAVRADIDTSRVKFERGFAQLTRDTGLLAIRNGVLRGPLIGSTFQGTLYDPQGRMEMTGTFMPAYGLNRIFGEIPLLGGLLGNGRDRGLIGVTFKLEGDAKKPKLHINPLSVIAPGIFRSIFEFR